MIIPWVGLKNEPKYDSLRQSSVDNIILSWSILRKKNLIGVHTTSPSNITFSPLITNIPRGISPYCFPTCIRSTVLCSTKFATASKTMSCLVCHFKLGHQNQGNLWSARLSWSPFHSVQVGLKTFLPVNLLASIRLFRPTYIQLHVLRSSGCTKFCCC